MFARPTAIACSPQSNWFCRSLRTSMFTGFLDDAIPEERSLGLSMGLELLKRCDEVWVFGNKITEGMESEIKAALELNILIQYFDERCERRTAHSDT